MSIFTFESDFKGILGECFAPMERFSQTFRYLFTSSPPCAHDAHDSKFISFERPAAFIFFAKEQNNSLFA
jgi:hypothetical protein